MINVKDQVCCGPRTDPDRKSGNPQAGVKMVCQL